MYSSRSGCGCNSCNRNGERILVNQSGNGCNNRRCSCENTYRPGSGCGNNWNNGCECKRPCPPKPCPPKPCPPKPCPPKPCHHSCEDRCRSQYHNCMRKCRCHDEDNYREEEHDYGCGKRNSYEHEENENFENSNDER